MPFCPKCRYEYRPEISFCPDCNERLVTTLSDHKENEIEGNSYEGGISEEWIPLAKLSSHMTAEMLVDLLHSKQIPAVIMSGTGHLGPIGQMAMTPFRIVSGAYIVMIPKEFIEDAGGEAAAMLGDDWETLKLIR
jgi:hypothetical protein